MIFVRRSEGYDSSLSSKQKKSFSKGKMVSVRGGEGYDSSLSSKLIIN